MDAFCRSKCAKPIEDDYLSNPVVRPFVNETLLEAPRIQKLTPFGNHMAPHREGLKKLWKSGQAWVEKMEMKTSFQLLFKIKFIADFIWKYKLLLFDKGDVADVGAGSRFKAWVVGTGLTTCNFSLYITLWIKYLFKRFI